MTEISFIEIDEMFKEVAEAECELMDDEELEELEEQIDEIEEE